MDTEIVRKVFIRFLKNNGALRQFIECCQGYDCCKRHIESKSALCILASAFVWHLTRQGHNYWMGIDEKWANLLLKLSKTELKEPLGIDRDEIKKRVGYCQYKMARD